MTLEAVPDVEAEVVEPSIDELPEDTALATIMVEEGITMLNRAAIRACEGMRREANLRLAKPDNDWLFSQVYLASIAANQVLGQARGVMLAAKRPDIDKYLSKQCKSALIAWGAGVQVCEDLVNGRMDGHDLSADRSPAQIDLLRQFLVTMIGRVIPKAQKAMKQNAKARLKRVGKKEAARIKEQTLAIEARALKLLTQGRPDDGGNTEEALDAEGETDILGVESGEREEGSASSPPVEDAVRGSEA